MYWFLIGPQIDTRQWYYFPISFPYFEYGWEENLNQKISKPLWKKVSKIKDSPGKPYKEDELHELTLS